MTFVMVMLARTVLVSSGVSPLVPICSKTFSLGLLLIDSYYPSNTGVHKSRVSGRQCDKVCTVVPNVCVAPQHGAFCVTCLAPRILRKLLEFWKTFTLLTD
jgi:hypothetical protein